MKEETIRIKTADGEMDAFLTQPSGPGPYPCILVAHEAFGLNNHIRSVTRRLANGGIIGLAPNLYYRTPGAVAGYDELPKALSLMGGLYDDKVISDMDSAISFLESLPQADPDKIGMMGFCMGGRVTFLTACHNPKIKAAVPFYGGAIGTVWTEGPQTPKAPLEYAAGLRAPILLLYGEKDAFIPQAEIDKIQERLTQLGKNGECVVYPGADHGFFCDERASYHAEAAADAWERIGKFFQQHMIDS